MAIDSIDWHQGGDLPADLDPSAAATHIGMFFAWVILNDVVSEKHADDHAEALEAVHDRSLTGRAYLLQNCAGTLNDDDLDDDAQAFAKAYYGADAASGSSPYLEDYEHTLAAGLPSIYHVQDAWDNYDLLAPVIDAAYERWRAEQN